MTVAAANRLTLESKALLRATVRGLRESLIRDLRTSVDQTYLLQVPSAKASQRLSADRRERRRRLEEALAQRAQEEGGTSEARERVLLDAVKETGATLLNRLVLIRHLEAMGLSKPAIITGGWKSPGYVEFRGFAGALCQDDTQGYGVLLQLVFDELAQALPGLFGDVGFTKLIPVPPETLRALVEALNGIPSEAWRDDMTLGWVYQYWNDPDREALDAKLNERGKLEHHEIASKTQMFTERYIVEWLLQNSLGPTWLAMCRKNGWKAEVETRGLLAALEARRTAWRKMREAGEVEPGALMPIYGPLEEAWKYYVPQLLTEDAVRQAPRSIRDLKLLDPACGSGHFLVVAFDLLVALYGEEARHRGESWSDHQIAQWILEDNLYGVDIDPRAVQIAAAALFLKAKALSTSSAPHQVNLVAPALRLSTLSKDDPALVRLETDILAETSIPAELTRQIIEVLGGVDYLGTLLRVGDAVDKAIEAHQAAMSRAVPQSELFVASVPSKSTPVTKSDAKKAVSERLNAFLSSHAGEEDLGLRLRGEQLAAGVRFAGIVKEGQFDIVVGNPPYQGTSKLKDASYVARYYPTGKSDLCAAFLERGIELCRPSGVSAMVTMRSWMFLIGFTGLRERLLGTCQLPLILDLGSGAFDEVSAAQVVLSVCCSIFRKEPPAQMPDSLAFRPTAPDDRFSTGMTSRKRAAILSQMGRFSFDVRHLRVIEGQPLVYWWDARLLQQYSETTKLAVTHEVRKGLCTGNNVRFNRFWWEVPLVLDDLTRCPGIPDVRTRYQAPWQPTIVGAKGQRWFEPLHNVVRWNDEGLEIRVLAETSTAAVVPSRGFYFRQGVAFAAIGSAFSGRLHRYSSVFGDKAPSVFGADLSEIVCLLNSSLAQEVLSSLNPSMSFQAGDVRRLPRFELRDAKAVMQRVADSFDEHEACREASVEFSHPGRSCWSYADAWARRVTTDFQAIDAPPFEPEFDAPTPEQLLSFEIGCTLGRFDVEGQGVLRTATTTSLPNGIFYLSPNGQRDSLDAPQSERGRAAWQEHFGQLRQESMSTWMREKFFAHHRSVYENRPIYFPLASAKRSFVAFISIHCWTDSTLSILLADHLLPERKALEGSLVDLQVDRNSAEKKTRVTAERRYIQCKKQLEELEEFITQVRQCAENGPPPPDNKTPPREVDSPYRMDLDDGVMVNSAALWPLLEPMWRNPKTWWKELATAKGRKDYDWSHLAARYFPDRVDEKCRNDPSLAVAHGRFWKYHPEKAYEWELRLRHEIGTEFSINEADSDALRAAFRAKNAAKARELEEAEQSRRDRKARRQDQDELDLPDSEALDSDEEEVEDLSA